MPLPPALPRDSEVGRESRSKLAKLPASSGACCGAAALARLGTLGQRPVGGVVALAHHHAVAAALGLDRVVGAVSLPPAHTASGQSRQRSTAITRSAISDRWSKAATSEPGSSASEIGHRRPSTSAINWRGRAPIARSALPRVPGDHRSPGLLLRISRTGRTVVEKAARERSSRFPGDVPWPRIKTSTSLAFEPTSKRRRGFPSETRAQGRRERQAARRKARKERPLPLWLGSPVSKAAASKPAAMTGPSGTTTFRD